MIIAFCYTYSLVVGGNVEGASFVTLQGVTNIFRRGNDWVLNGCWLHYLALDLVVGLSICKDATERSMSPWVIKPILLLTLMYGPGGYLAYQVLKLALVGEL